MTGMTCNELINDACHIWIAAQALHNCTYVAIVGHVGNPSRVENVLIVDLHKLSSSFCRSYRCNAGLFLWLTIDLPYPSTAVWMP